MKNVNPLIVFVLLLFYIPSFSQSSSSTEPDLYYVVIGAFANPRNADEFAANAKKKHLEAHSTFIPSRKLHYVYIQETHEKSDAVSLAIKLQKESTFSDTWVYSSLLTDNPVAVKIDKTELVQEEKPQTVTVEEKQAEVVPAKPTDGSKTFVFKLRSVDSGESVSGDVDIFDADIIKGRKLVSYRGNDVVNVKPVNKSGNLLVVCDQFGYRKVQLPVNFNDPKIEDAVTSENGNIVVNFDLVRLKKGDKVVMYNVYFFNHAAIMRPESRYEVNALLEMLKEKPTSKIKIHGHANGNDFGQIITLGSSNEYFALSSQNNEGKGSSTKLSEERARIIQSYLVSQGIDINRMELKAWGGKMPIYEKDHAMAHANVRVEIEITEE
jgi:outer membrane protein OmpA-like peptidoglycan-associated protein